MPNEVKIENSQVATKHKGRKRVIILITIMIILLLSFLICLQVQYANRIELTQLSNQGISQMMGYVIKTKNNGFIVIDGGTEEDSQNLKKYIDQHNGIVDYWLITHPHSDHIGAMVALLEKDEVQIKNMVCSLHELEWYQQNDSKRASIVERLYQTLAKNETIQIKEAHVGDNIKIENVRVEILGIKNPEIIQNSGNNSSMVFKVHVNQKSILFLGDTGEESSKKLIETNGEKLQSYAVQMAHHGQAGATKEVYELVNPQVCLWPTPDWLWDNNLDHQGYNTGNWKTLETRKWMEELQVKMHYIEKDGDITIKIW